MVAIRESNNEEGYLEFMTELETLIEDPDYNFTSDTLGGIQDWCDKTRVVTENQVEAVENIRGSIDEK